VQRLGASSEMDFPGLRLPAVEADVDMARAVLKALEAVP